jgi:hypothetical protein
MRGLKWVYSGSFLVVGVDARQRRRVLHERPELAAQPDAEGVELQQLGAALDGRALAEPTRLPGAQRVGLDAERLRDHVQRHAERSHVGGRGRQVVHRRRPARARPRHQQRRPERRVLGRRPVVLLVVRGQGVAIEGVRRFEEAPTVVLQAGQHVEPPDSSRPDVSAPRGGPTMFADDHGRSLTRRSDGTDEVSVPATRPVRRARRAGLDAGRRRLREAVLARVNGERDDEEV